MLTVRAAKHEDAALLGPNLRAADLREIAAVSTEAPVTLLQRSIALSDPCQAVEVDGAPIALFGVAPPGRHRPHWRERGAGHVWMLASPVLEQHAVHFLRQSRQWLGVLHERYPILAGHVDVRNEVHIRWMKWCGFELLDQVEHGVTRSPFYEFMRVAGDADVLR